MNAPTTSADFDRAYRAPITPWGDIRVPAELRALIAQVSPRTSLELGCGLGRFSTFAAEQGVAATGVDFSPVAIERARQRVAGRARRPDFLARDVTDLAGLEGPFDVAFDVGCFHCLGAEASRAYAREVGRVLAPGHTLLVWAIDDSPSGQRLSPASVRDVFAGTFDLGDAKAVRRRLVASHWYWLRRV